MTTNQTDRSRGWLRPGRKAGLGGMVAALAVATAGWILTGTAARAQTPVPAPADMTAARAAAPAPASYADVVDRVAPAVVIIRSERVVDTAGGLPSGDGTWMRRFFGDQFDQMPAPRERRASGAGSGVIVAADGYVLTNHHVIEDARTIEVELADRRVFDARVVGSDPPTDLAVLKIDATDLPVLPLGDSTQVRVGDVVLAIGNPLGIGQTVTMGIVSAKSRATGLGDGGFQDFLQIDAPINQGNSGGALVDTTGRLVGINSQILSPSGGNIGIGFAIPASMARNVMDQLIGEGHVRRGLLGVTVQTVTSDLAASLDLPEVRGALVSEVGPDTPAADAGMRRGDVVTAFDGVPVSDANGLRNAVAAAAPDHTSTVTVIRDGRELTLTATLAALTATADAASPTGGAGSDSDRWGMRVEPLTPELARRHGMDDTTGVVVNQVDPRGAAAAAGIAPGDVIEQVNRQPVATAGALGAALGAPGDRPALVLLRRDGHPLFVTMQPNHS